MRKRKFKVTVTRTSEFEVEFDKEVWSQKNIDDWKKVFYDVEDLRDVAEVFGTMYADEEEGAFLEGFGVPLKDGKIPFPQILTAEGCESVKRDINVLGLSKYYETDVEEVK